MTSWSSSIKNWFLQAYRIHYYVMVYKKYVPLVKQNVMKLEFFILGGQRIDQKRKKDGEGGEERGLRKGAERIEIERKQTKGK